MSPKKRLRAHVCDRLLNFVAEGTGADRQIDIFGKAKAAGRRRLTALQEVTDWAAAETQGRRPIPALSL